MTTKIYVEGGGDNEDTITRCRKGFADYCANAAPGKPKPRIVPCGGRDQAFKHFRAAVERGKTDETYVLLVDAESSVSASNPIEHLHAQDAWRFPKLHNNQVFLMVQAMEAWFLADRVALEAFYGAGFLTKSLPGLPTSVEGIFKNDLEPSLNHAAKPTVKKEYHKTKHGFALLGLIDPAKVEKASLHAALFHQFLRSL